MEVCSTGYIVLHLEMNSKMFFNLNENQSIMTICGFPLSKFKIYNSMSQMMCDYLYSIVLVSYRLKWFGHVRREEGHVLRRAVELEVVGKRLVGRPRKTWGQGVEEDLRHLNVREDMVCDRQQWRQLMSRPTPAVGQDGR